MNCQLYSGWRLGKRKSGVIPTGKDWLSRQVTAAKYGVYDSAGVLGLLLVRETTPQLLTLAMKPFGRRELDSKRVAAAISGKVEAMRWARAWGAGLDLEAKKRLEAWGRDDGVFITLSPSLGTSVAEVPFPFFFLFPGPEPATCA